MPGHPKPADYQNQFREEGSLKYEHSAPAKS